MDFAASSTLLIIPDAHKFGSMEPHWCWLDDSIQWIEYGKQHPNYSVATITSAQVEKAFQADQEGTLRFRVHSQQYEINFKDMVQRNLRTQMTRQICWWPNDTSSGDRSQQKESMEKCWYCLDESNQWNEYGEESPNHCAATVTSARVEKAFQADQKGTLRFQTGYQQHEIDKLQRHGPEKSAHTDDKTNLLVAKRCLWWRRDPAEGKHPDQCAAPIPSAQVELLFQTHQEGACEFEADSQKYELDFKEMVQRNLNTQTIIKICRSPSAATGGSSKQNKKRQKEQMKRRSPGQEIDKRLLFHGTSPSHLSAICEQNFDWRVCGAHGTLYGRGSYFARDASYSHQYCPSSTGPQSMFVAHVLVGDFVQGNSEYLRPPPRPGNPNRLYDSCVDDPKDPSIFVIFEKHQIYPAYILE